MENKIIKNIKNFSKFINENTENTVNTEIFYVGEIIIYNYKYTAKVVKVHDNSELLDVILYHPKSGIVTEPTSISSLLCDKFKQSL